MIIIIMPGRVVVAALLGGLRQQLLPGLLRPSQTQRRLQSVTKFSSIPYTEQNFGDFETDYKFLIEERFSVQILS